MGWFNRGTEVNAMRGTLTPDEQAVLARLEQTVEAGVQASLTVLEAGKALAEIRDRQLFRDTSKSWETYVETRFKISRRRADQMISFAGVQETLQKTGTRVPDFVGEVTLRPLAGLDEQAITEAFNEAASSPDGLTVASVRKAAARRKKAKAGPARPRRFRVPGATVTITFNRKSTGSAIDALAAAIRQAEDELLAAQANEAA